jgi:hypothetical protein
MNPVSSVSTTVTGLVNHAAGSEAGQAQDHAGGRAESACGQRPLRSPHHFGVGLALDDLVQNAGSAGDQRNPQQGLNQTPMNACNARSHGSQVESRPGGKDHHRGHPNLEKLLIIRDTRMQHLGLSRGTFGHDQVAGHNGIDSVGSHGSTFLVVILISILVSIFATISFSGWKSFINATLMIASKRVRPLLGSKQKPILTARR